MFRKALFLFGICCASFIIHAQEPVNIHLSEKNGLPDKEFYDIIEDSKGFIWLSADKGLFRYDGKSYKNYTHPKQQGLSVFNTQEDHLGRIWCNNISGQFFYIENKALHLFIDLSGILKGELVNFVIEKNNMIIYADRGIYKINLSTKKVVKVFEIKKETLGAPFVFNNTTFVASGIEIYSLTPDYKVTTALSKLIESSGSVPQKEESFGDYTIFKIKNSLYYRVLKNKTYSFFKLDLENNNAIPVSHFNAIANQRIYNQFEIEDAIWFTTNAGVWVFEKLEASYVLKKRFLSKKNVTKVIKDKDANYWLTTLNDGIYIIPDINITKLPENSKNITSLDVINNNTLVYGNITGKIGVYNLKTYKSKFINLTERDRVSKIRYHPNLNSVFISTDFNGFILNPKTQKLVESKLFRSAKSLTVINDDKLLITTNNEVRLFNNTTFSNKSSRLFDQKRRTYESYFDSTKNTIYIAYIDALMYYDSTRKGNEVIHENKPIYAKSITKTANEVIWVGTFKNGIYAVKNDSVIKHYTIKNGLTSNHIEKIKADENNLWIASDNSIQLLNTVNHNFQTYKKVDGVISYDISDIVPLQDKIYFSSNEGLFSIDKNSTQKIQQPKVYFDTVEINEKETQIQSSYKLEYNQNAIKIGFNVNGFLYNQKKGPSK